jgi:hypothetical protein
MSWISKIESHFKSTRLRRLAGALLVMLVCTVCSGSSEPVGFKDNWLSIHYAWHADYLYDPSTGVLGIELSAHEPLTIPPPVPVPITGTVVVTVYDGHGNKLAESTTHGTGSIQIPNVSTDVREVIITTTQGADTGQVTTMYHAP